jgi:hypothetical protein
MHRDLIICRSPFWHVVAPPATELRLGSF